MRKQPGIVKVVSKKLPWLEHIIESSKVAKDLNYEKQLLFHVPKGSLCVACKGSKMLCGKRRCPLLSQIYAYLRNRYGYDKEHVEGDSPPSVFIGRIGYPYVYAGPLVPPLRGNTSIYDFPEKWLNLSIDEIVDYRFKLVRGKFKVHVKKFEGPLMDATMELALSESPVYADMLLKRKPFRSFILDDDVQPIGPSAPITLLDIGNPKWDKHVQKAYYDDDLKASEAVIELYRKGVPVSRIQKCLSVGAFGIKQLRRLVPTRWSITAVDSIISQELMSNVKRLEPINEYRVYEANFLDNSFIVLMMPDGWRYELIEAWYPGTTWNPSNRNIIMLGDWEPYTGRTTYASIGGCYYAARLAVTEHLSKIGRQASVVIFREARPGYIMPVGVWVVRETVRKALREKPLKFDAFKDAITYIAKRLRIDISYWINESKVIREHLKQRKLTEYIKHE